MGNSQNNDKKKALLTTNQQQKTQSEGRREIEKTKVATVNNVKFQCR